KYVPEIGLDRVDRTPGVNSSSQWTLLKIPTSTFASFASAAHPKGKRPADALPISPKRAKGQLGSFAPLALSFVARTWTPRPATKRATKKIFLADWSLPEDHSLVLEEGEGTWPFEFMKRARPPMDST
ncbi:UNVERIFIED_CONTAM: hypothetical protein Sradi_4145800, partial [Sesamum radiatum]